MADFNQVPNAPVFELRRHSSLDSNSSSIASLFEELELSPRQTFFNPEQLDEFATSFEKTTNFKDLVIGWAKVDIFNGRIDAKFKEVLEIVSL
jgi:hypothetical protein